MKNWQRNHWMDEINTYWVNPSPNIPDLETAILYPGMCLLEATNINEGRGTTKPFKRFGAPWINKQKLAMELNNLNLPGVVFKPVSYIPIEIKGMATDPKYENQVCHGIDILLTNRNSYNSVDTAIKIISLISKQYPNTLEIKTLGMNRLWGNNMRITSLNLDRSFDKQTLLKNFNDLSKKYYLYD
jgi:uncharacterized protein YbbC (DUF1343 family)